MVETLWMFAPGGVDLGLLSFPGVSDVGLPLRHALLQLGFRLCVMYGLCVVCDDK